MQAELAADQQWVTAEFGEVYWPTKIAVGIGIDIDVKGEFWCTAHVAWGDMQSTATRQASLKERTAPIESIEVASLLSELHAEVQEACIAMLRELASTQAE